MTGSPQDRANSCDGATAPPPTSLLSALLTATGSQPRRRGPARKTPAPPRERRTGSYQPPAADQPLTSLQRATLGRLASKAYTKLSALDLVDGLSETDWRHREVWNAVKRDGIRACDNRQYCALVEIFASQAGDGPKALAAALKMSKGNFRAGRDEHPEQVSQALWRLKQRLQKRGLTEAWALAVARQRFGVAALDRLCAAELQIILMEAERLYRPLKANETEPVRRR